MKAVRNILVLTVAFWLFAAPAGAQFDPNAYDVYKYSQDGTAVPDVDKSPFPPLPTDKSCWMSAASNLLGGSGWGDANKTAQKNADDIYGHMTSHFGTDFDGDAALAVNWWLYNYGYNPDQAGSSWYRPTKTYNDVTSVTKMLLNTDYDMLLHQLDDCQYVAVTWVVGEFPNERDHVITLVGGNWSNIHVPPGNPLQSVWHDSDVGVSPSDDVYNNAFAVNTGQWTMPAYPASMATGYTYLCPGEQKPDSAMSNYDAAYYRDQDANDGSISRVWRLAGQNAATYGQPNWQQDANADWTILRVENEVIEDKYKKVYLLVDFRAGAYTEQTAPDIDLRTGEDGSYTYYDPNLNISPGGGQILYEWTLDDQPPHEEIIFPDETFYWLSQNVKDFNIAIECIPEPATMALLAVAAVTPIRRRRK